MGGSQRGMGERGVRKGTGGCVGRGAHGALGNGGGGCRVGWVWRTLGVWGGSPCRVPTRTRPRPARSRTAPRSPRRSGAAPTPPAAAPRARPRRGSAPCPADAAPRSSAQPPAAPRSPRPPQSPYPLQVGRQFWGRLAPAWVHGAGQQRGHLLGAQRAQHVAQQQLGQQQLVAAQQRGHTPGELHRTPLGHVTQSPQHLWGETGGQPHRNSVAARGQNTERMEPTGQPM